MADFVSDSYTNGYTCRIINKKKYYFLNGKEVPDNKVPIKIRVALASKCIKQEENLDEWNCRLLNQGIEFRQNGKIIKEEDVPTYIREALSSFRLPCEDLTTKPPSSKPSSKPSSNSKKPSSKPNSKPPSSSSSKKRSPEKSPKRSPKRTPKKSPEKPTGCREINGILECKDSKQAYEQPETLGKTRSQTLYKCKGGFFSRTVTVTEDKVDEQRRKGKKCTPRK